MSKLRKISIIILTILTIGIIWIGANINPVKADGENIDAQTVLKKILLGTIDFCDNYRMPESVNFVKELSGNGNEIFGFHDSSFEQLFNESGQAEVLNLPNQGFLPNHYPDTISCYQLFSGKDGTSFKGLFSIFGKDSYSDEDNNDKSVLEKLGYSVTDLDDYNTTCYAIQIKIPKIQNGFITPDNEYVNYYSNALCFKTKDINENNTSGSAVYESAIKINDENITGKLKNGETYACTKIGTSECAIKIEMEPSQTSGFGTWQYTNNVQQIKNLTQDPYTQSDLTDLHLDQTFPQYLYKNDECTGENEDSVNLKCQIEYLAEVVKIPYIYNINFGDEDDSLEAIVEVVEIDYNSDKQYLKEATRSNDTIKEYFTTDDTGSQTFDPTITGEDRLFLDFYYIQQVIDDDTNNIVIDGNQCYPSIPDADDYFYIYTQYNGVTEWCKLTGDYATDSEPMYSIISQGYINWLNGIPNITVLGQETRERPQGIMASVHFEHVLDDYKTLVGDGNIPIAYIVGGNNNHSQNNNQIESPITDNPTCLSESAAGALAWIVCPLIEQASSATGSLYSNYVEPLLEIKSNDFFSNNSTRKAWETFQNISNVLFIILLLIIIFSQLTGIGIDNYGIKKILPRLIIIIIIVNLSYPICQVLVELSNIVGSSLYQFFNGLNSTGSTTLTITNETINNTETMSIPNTGLVAIEIILGLTGLFFLYNNPAVFLSLCVSILGSLIAILFLFFLLSVRQAIVIILAVIAPLAIIAYALPNTKTWYTKWWKLLSGLLIVYPICGFIVGGGNYASKIILANANDNVPMIIAAILIGITPIFFIPSVLKGSFSAMGKIGGTLTGLGNMAKKGATRSIRGSEKYKAARMRGLETSIKRKAGFNAKGQVTGIGALKSKFASSKLGQLSGYQRLQASRVAMAEKSMDQDIQQLAQLKSIGAKRTIAKKPKQSTESILREQLEKAAKKGDNNAIFSAIEQMQNSNMQASHIAQATRDFLGDTSILNMKEGQRKTFLEEFAKKYGNSFLQKDFEQADWARKGGFDHNNNASGLGTGGQWAIDNMSIDDMKDNDVAALSSERLYDLIKSGKITEQQAQRVWAANGNMDETNRLMLGAYGNDGIELSKQRAQFELNSKAIGPKLLTPDQLTKFTRRSTTDVQFLDDSKEMNVLTRTADNTGDTVLNTRQTAINTNRTANNTERTAANTDQIVTNTGDTVLNTRQTAINTNRTANNTERTANGIDDVNSQLRQHTTSSMDAAVVQYDNDRIYEIVTDPNIANTDPLKVAADKEMQRRIREGTFTP